jgi:hypothetical protein
MPTCHGPRRDDLTVADRKAPNVPIAKEILRYFLRNPEAADSLRELSRWRLMEERIHRSVQNTREAVDWLISQGYLREETRIGTDSLYLFNSARRAEAESFLKEVAKHNGVDG